MGDILAHTIMFLTVIISIIMLLSTVIEARND